MGYPNAFNYLLKTQGNSDAVADGIYKGIKFSFRRRDISAVKEILKNGEYDFLRKVIQDTPRPSILDIGAHIGLFSIWALSINPDCRICSVEASPETYKILSSNIEISKKSGLSWSSYHRAAWGEPGEISFMDNSESTMSHRVGKNGTVNIKTITIHELASIYEAGGVFDVVKIDIEGAEESFLCHSDFDFTKFRSLVIEIHPDLCNTMKVEKILNDNFSVMNVKDKKNNSKPLLYCTR